MPSKYPLFDRSRLLVKPLAERVNDLQLSHWMALTDAPPDYLAHTPTDWLQILGIEHTLQSI